MIELLRRAPRAIVQGVIAAALAFLLTWGILMATNPTGLFDQSSAAALAADSLSTFGVVWGLYPAFACAVAALGIGIHRLGKRWRTFLAFGAAVLIGAVPLGIGLITAGDDSGVLLVLVFGIVYLPFVLAATAAAGCVYGFILPGKRRSRVRR